MSIRILIGDCRTELAKLSDQSVHCCVTSPPYFGLRDYGTATWGGGDPTCDHLGEPFRTSANINANWDGGNDFKNATKRQPFKSECGKCGARRIDSQIGLEPTPDAFVAEMVAVFREVRRVLRDDGTLWLNLGDSYSGGGNGGGGSFASERNGLGRVSGLKPKDLIGIPWRVAFALQADGWYLRQDIIWSKPNPMPESVTDRCTKAHEYIFLMSKSARYFYDAKAIQEPFVYNGDVRINTAYAAATGKKPTREYKAPLDQDGRNKRSVWEVTTSPYSEAHFATFPPALIKPCILAGCPVGGTVLDPFGGAGTTGLVADRLQRSSVMIELNPEYAAMADRRIHGDAPLFVEAAE